jgi:uncharacterized protein (UPF0303 family)
MSLENLLEQLESEHENLRFAAFTFEDALAIGLDLVNVGRQGSLPIAVDISLNQQVLFHAALPGSAVDNDHWVIRKNRVVGRFFRSSLYIATQLRRKGKSIEEVYGLPSVDYAPYGGAVPIFITGVGVVGTITVSGLPDQEDHQMVVDAIRRHLSQRTRGGRTC